MDELERWSIESLIESRTGSRGRLYVFGDDPNLLLDAVLKTRLRLSLPMERRFTVFIVDQGVPDLFTLTGFSSTVICYHVGYVGKFIKFRAFIMGDPEDDTIDRHGIANLFEIVSGLYLLSNNPTFATLCLLQSIIETPFRSTDEQLYHQYNSLLHSSLPPITNDPSTRPPTTAASEREATTETFYISLYFGLAHEIGHTYATDCLRQGTLLHSREITTETITRAVVDAAKSHFDSLPGRMGNYYFKRWHEGYLVASQDERSFLHCSNLRSEILADYLGFNILFTSMVGLSRVVHKQLNFKSIVCEVIVALFVVQLLESCKYLVAALPDEQTNPELQTRYFQGLPVVDAITQASLNAHERILDFQIAHIVRWQFLRPSLISVAMMHLFPDSFSVRDGKRVATCSAAELKRRETIAANNVDRYPRGYTNEMWKLQGRLGDVALFASHLATDEVPKYMTGGPADATTFGEFIARRFDTYVDRLAGEQGAERRREILVQLAEYDSLLRRRGEEEAHEQIASIVHRLESGLEKREVDERAKHGGRNELPHSM